MTTISQFSRFLLLAFMLLTVAVPANADSVEQLLTELGEAQSDTTRLRLLETVSSKLLGSDPKLAQQYAGQLLELSKDLNDSQVMVHSYQILGTSLAMRNQCWEGMEHFRKGLTVSQKLNDGFKSAQLLNNMGIAFDQLGYPVDALQQYQEGLKYAVDNDLNRLEVSLRMNIAVLHQRLDAPEKANEEMLHVLDLLEQVNDSALHWKSLASVAGIALELDQVHRAADLLAVAREMATPSNDQFTLARIHQLMAKVHLAQQQHDKAITELERGRKLFIDLGAGGGQAEILFQLGMVYQDLKDYDLAVDFYGQALEQARKFSMQPLEREAQISLSETYQAAGDYQQALYHLQAHGSLKDAQLGENQRNELQRLNLLYKLRENQELMEAQKATNDVKDVLLVLAAVLLSLVITLAYVIWKYLQANRSANIRLKQLNQLLWERSNARTNQIIKLAHYNAHEVRAPLARIQGLVNVMRTDIPRNPELTGNLEMLESSAHDLDRVIHRMNDIIHKGPPAVDRLSA